MVVGIYALNIRGGGGATHLVEILSKLDESNFNIERVVLWSSSETLLKVEDRPWLHKKIIKQTQSSVLKKFILFFLNIKKLALQEGCDILFFPGGSFNTTFRPVVTMHRNLLPFESKEILRYGFSLYIIKFFLLRLIQTRSMKKADGVIFLTEFAKSRITDRIGQIDGEIEVINHGVNDSFFLKPKTQFNISDYNFGNPYKVINISLFNPYKHQWNLALAISNLRQKGLPIECHFVGGGHEKSIKRLEKVIEDKDPNKEFLFYHGEIEYKEIKKFYQSADMLAYTSSVETFGQTLVEGMASGLPIACSDMSCMPEILEDGGVYFDPLDINSIEDCLFSFISNKKLRKEKSQRSFQRAQSFSWESAAKDTFQLIRNVMLKSKE